MLLSMTGFGKATGSFQGKKVTVEVRSLNSKTLDLNVRIASNYRELEPQIRNIISAELDRGKIDVNINIDSTGDTKNFSINKDLAKAYFQDLKDVNSRIGGSTEDYLSLILRMPEIYNNEREELGDEEKAWLLSLCQDACASLNEFRRQEGLALENEFNQRIGEIKSLLEQVPKYEQERIEIVRSRIKKGLEELQNIQFDTNRLEQEMIFYIEKLDVSEEKMRLSNHLDYYLETMILPKSVKVIVSPYWTD